MLAEHMRRDPGVWALGEDIAEGGIFGQYRGLVDEFGPERIVSTPISEGAMVGSAVGAAMLGTRPVVELRFADFALCATDEIVNQAAKWCFMFGGQTRVPLVVRLPMGIWRSLRCAAQPVTGSLVGAHSGPGRGGGGAPGRQQGASEGDDPV